MRDPLTHPTRNRLLRLVREYFSGLFIQVAEFSGGEFAAFTIGSNFRSDFARVTCFHGLPFRFESDALIVLGFRFVLTTTQRANERYGRQDVYGRIAKCSSTCGKLEGQWSTPVTWGRTFEVSVNRRRLYQKLVR